MMYNIKTHAHMLCLLQLCMLYAHKKEESFNPPKFIKLYKINFSGIVIILVLLPSSKSSDKHTNIFP